MAINTSELDKAVSFINAYGSLLKDEDNVKFFASLPESIDAAKKAMADNEEKYAIMLDCVTRWANQLAFALFRDNAITDEPPFDIPDNWEWICLKGACAFPVIIR